MKITLLLFGLLSVIATAQATLPPPWVAGTGQFRREIYEVWVDPMDTRGPRWNAERHEWPFPITRAVESARAELKKIMGESHRHFSLREATLRRFYSSPADDKASWYFLVVFESVQESLITRMQSSGYSPAVFPFVVFPDGSVNAPQKRKPNKTPEPTP